MIQKYKQIKKNDLVQNVQDIILAGNIFLPLVLEEETHVTSVLHSIPAVSGFVFIIFYLFLSVIAYCVHYSRE